LPSQESANGRKTTPNGSSPLGVEAGPLARFGSSRLPFAGAALFFLAAGCVDGVARRENRRAISGKGKVNCT